MRVLSATNADLKAMIQAGTFREDLYYRLNVIEVNLPPLTEHTDDILQQDLGMDWDDVVQLKVDAIIN